MLKIWTLKQQAAAESAAGGNQKKKKVTAAQLRVQKGKRRDAITLRVRLNKGYP